MIKHMNWWLCLQIYTYTHILFIAKLPFLQVGSPSPDTVEIVLVVSSQADGFINIKQNMPGDDDFIKTSLVILVCLKAVSIFESFRSPLFLVEKKTTKEKHTSLDVSLTWNMLSMRGPRMTYTKT